MLDTQERIALTCVNPQELSRISTNGSRPTTGRRQNTNRFSSEKVPSRHFEPSQGTVSPAVEGWLAPFRATSPRYQMIITSSRCERAIRQLEEAGSMSADLRCEGV